MLDPGSVLHAAAQAIGWRFGQARCLAAALGEPLRRTARLLAEDDAGPSLVELAATRELIRLGRPGSAGGTSAASGAGGARTHDRGIMSPLL